MQIVSQAFLNLLDQRSRDLLEVVELYAADYVIPEEGFRPQDAIRRFAKSELTWRGITYERQVISRGSISRSSGAQFNNVTVTFSNVGDANRPERERMAAFILNHPVQGMHMVIRIISRSVIDSSVVEFTGRCDKPDGFDEDTGSIPALEDLASVLHEVPARKYIADDPEGRAIDDPLYEGFRFVPISGTFTYHTVETKRFLLFFKKKKTVTHTEQWSAEDNTPYGNVVNEVLGRCQIEGVPLVHADTGSLIKFLMSFANGKIEAITNIKNQTQGFSEPTSVTVHLGDLGGQFTNSASDPQFPNAGKFSRTAYIGGQVSGSDPTVKDSAPIITAVILGRVVPVPLALAGVGSELHGEYYNGDNFNTLVVEQDEVDPINYYWPTGVEPFPGMDDPYTVRWTGKLTPAFTAEYTFYLTHDDGVKLTVDGDLIIDEWNDVGENTGTIDLVADTEYDFTLEFRNEFELGVSYNPGYVSLYWSCFHAAKQLVQFKPQASTQIFNGNTWTDNPAYLTRFALTNLEWLRLPEHLVEDSTFIKAAEICDERILDDTNTDHIFVPEPEIANAGVTFRRFRSTGLLNVHIFRKLLQLDPSEGALIDGPYFDFDPDDPPVSIDPDPLLRRRYTLNVPVTDTAKAIDILRNTILPSFRGFITKGSNGKYRLNVERPADSVLIRDHVFTGAQEIPVEDIEPWRESLEGLILIGNGLLSAETRVVTAFRYSDAGNDVTLEASATGTTTATESGATLSGGTDDIAPSGTITIGGTTAAGDVITATIDGVAVTHNVENSETTGTVAGQLTAQINANATLKRYLKAEWSIDNPTVVTVKSRMGWLEFEQPTQRLHYVTEEIIRISLALGPSDIFKGSFKWPLANREPTWNQWIGEYREAVADFGKRTLKITDKNLIAQLGGRVNPKKLDLTGVDNYNQASRLLNIEAAKTGDGNRFYQWKSSGRSLLLEEGDVVALTDDTGGFVNLAARIEDLSIPEEPWRSGANFTSRIYATNMFSDTASARPIILPSTLINRPISTAAVFGTDTGVPSAPDPPTVLKMDNVDIWMIQWLVPEDNATSLSSFRLQVRKASDTSVVWFDQILTVVTNQQVPMSTYDVKVRVKARNNYRESGSDGWSAWSSETTGAGTANVTPPDPVGGSPAFDPDPDDSRVPSKIGDAILS